MPQIQVYLPDRLYVRLVNLCGFGQTYTMSQVVRKALVIHLSDLEKQQGIPLKEPAPPRRTK